MKPTKTPDAAYLPVSSLDMGDRKMLVALNLIGFAMLFVFGWLFYQAAASLRSGILFPSSFLLLGGPELLALVVGLAAVIILHELIHGFFFWRFTGEKFELGVRPFYAFAASPDWYLPRSSFSVIGLSPFIIISLLGFVLIAIVPLGVAAVILVSLVVNAASSVGDFIVVIWLWLGTKSRLIRDTGPIMTIYEPASADIAAMSARWLELMADYQVEQGLARSVFTDLVERYSEEGRYYHNLHHVTVVLDTVESLKDVAQDYNVLRLAVWFHDVIYEAVSTENEALSAAYARETILKMGFSDEVASRTAELILLTADHLPPVDDIDGQILIDADLAPLGFEKAVFEKQTADIRLEFAHVPEDEYRESRIKFLTAMLARDRLFSTDQIYNAFENSARDNMKQALADLG